MLSRDQQSPFETAAGTADVGLPVFCPATYGPAPPGRTSREELERESRLLRSSPLMQASLDAMPLGVAVLNGDRQIVLANRQLLAALGCNPRDALGKRPGEALDCIQPPSGTDGCGTAKACHLCGAVKAILESQRTAEPVVRECRITVQTGDVLELRVMATKFSVGGEAFTILVSQDISGETRLDALTRTFFHDVINTAGCIRGFTQYLLSEGVDQECLESLHDLSERLLQEIESHRDLVHAEKGELEVVCESVDTHVLLHGLQTSYSRHPVGTHRNVDLRETWHGTVRTDQRLLLRVVGNMLKNALEATPSGGRVRLECRELGSQVVFSVQNDGVMTEEVQLQVFQRSFSTKAKRGRGLGAFSMKLLGERYLGGQVAFTSRAPEGTVFTFTLPKIAASHGSSLPPGERRG